MPSLRTLLVLGRASNLPTVWSNCLAGWLLGGGRNARNLFPLLLGATLLYLGGMFLNDAFDERFDAQHRRERPIPSGAISARSVWQIGFGLLAAGLACLFVIGTATGVLGLMLVGCIIIYDAVHKVITLSPILMAGCRFLLYVIASSTGAEGVTGWAVWCGLALAAYIIGLSFLARNESTGGAVNYWPCLALAVPVFLALLMNAGAYQRNAWLLSAALGLWIARSLRFAWQGADRNMGRAVSGLLAGIVLVDLLAVADVPHGLALVFIALLLLALQAQHIVPAT
jgi:4-hydroxybenzoate polyprenyltransferase